MLKNRKLSQRNRISKYFSLGQIRKNISFFFQFLSEAFFLGKGAVATNTGFSQSLMSIWTFSIRTFTPREPTTLINLRCQKTQSISLSLTRISSIKIWVRNNSLKNILLTYKFAFNLIQEQGCEPSIHNLSFGPLTTVLTSPDWHESSVHPQLWIYTEIRLLKLLGSLWYRMKLFDTHYLRWHSIVKQLGTHGEPDLGTPL